MKMQHPTLKNDLVPIGEFRANVAHWLHRLENGKRPVVLTQRGKAAAVLIKPEALDELEEERDVVHLVMRGLQEVQAGEYSADNEVWADVDKIIASRGADDDH
jgi:prevent-host-death family protein